MLLAVKRKTVSVHFLGDHNSLAQAISRALAESLPSHGDSSGRTTNMAELSGPLISAMNSTKSPAKTCL